MADNLQKYIKLFFIAFILFIIIGVMYITYSVSRMVNNKNKPVFQRDYAAPHKDSK